MSEPAMNLGPIETLLQDASITAIMIDENQIRYEKDGETHTSDLVFTSHDEKESVIQSIVQAGNETLSAENQTVDCVLSDGTKVHATYHPLTMELRKSAS